MKRLFFSLTTLIAMALLLTGCPSNTPEPPIPEFEGNFKFEILSVGKTDVSFRITPADSQQSYVALLVDKATYQSFPSVNAYLNDDIAWFEYDAESNGKTLEEYLEENLNVGVVESTVSGLEPDTEYMLYAYQMNVYGEIISDLEFEPFTTKGYDKTGATFALGVTDIGVNSAILSITPSAPKAYYFVNYFTEEEYVAAGGTESVFVDHLERLREHYLGYGVTPEDIIANLCFVGDQEFPMTGLRAGTNYVAYAIGVDDEFFANTDVVMVEFTSLRVEPSDMTFQIEISEVNYDQVIGSVTPSNNTEGYICSVQRASALDMYASDEEFMDALTDELKWLHGSMDKAIQRGPTDLAQFTGLAPDSDYVVVCFGWDGAPTTALYTEAFTTPLASGSIDEITFSFEIEELLHNSVTIKAIPSVGAYYFFSLIPESDYQSLLSSEGDEQSAMKAFANQEIDYGAEFFRCSRADYLKEVGACLGKYSAYFNQLTPQTTYRPYAVGVDLESGKIGAVVTLGEAITTPEKAVSAAQIEYIFGDYYDGTELAELDPEQFLRCKGCAVFPYKIMPNSEAVKWYTAFRADDYTSWGCTDDDLYTELIIYGANWNVPDVKINSTGGYAVLKYDQPYSFIGLAEDAAGVFGKGVIEVVTLSPEGVSPAEEFLATLEDSSSPRLAPPSVAPSRGYRPIGRTLTPLDN